MSLPNISCSCCFSSLLTLIRPHLSFQLPKFKFTLPLSGCVRELFSRLPNMDPELRTRFVEWLSYHLSNFAYSWPWER